MDDALLAALFSEAEVGIRDLTLRSSNATGNRKTVEAIARAPLRTKKSQGLSFEIWCMVAEEHLVQSYGVASELAQTKAVALRDAYNRNETAVEAVDCVYGATVEERKL